MSRITFLIAATILLPCFAAGLWGLSQIGGDRLVAVHWNIAGHRDRFAPARVAFLLMPVIGALALGLMAVLPAITPRGENLRRSRGAYGVICIAVVSLVTVVQGVIVSSALGYPVSVAGALPSLLGAMFIVIGNVLPKLRWNYVAGIRTPWTLADERVWDKTHRFGGWVVVLGGLVLLIAGVVPPYGPKAGLVAGVIGAVVLLTFVKSYLLWRDGQPRQGSTPPPAPETH